MKYIKLFEKNLKYNIDDYVEVEFIDDAEIMKIITFKRKFGDKTYDYGCEILNKSIENYNSHAHPYPVDKNEIIRKVEDYEVDANKYNL